MDTTTPSPRGKRGALIGLAIGLAWCIHLTIGLPLLHDLDWSQLPVLENLRHIYVPLAWMLLPASFVGFLVETVVLPDLGKYGVRMRTRFALVAYIGVAGIGGFFIAVLCGITGGSIGGGFLTLLTSTPLSSEGIIPLLGVCLGGFVATSVGLLLMMLLLLATGSVLGGFVTGVLRLSSFVDGLVTRVMHRPRV